MRSSFWTWSLVIIVSITLCFAVYETFQILSGKIIPDYASGIGELLLVIVLAVGEIFAFRHLHLELRNREWETWKKAQEVWTEKSFVKSRDRIFQRLRNKPKSWTVKEKKEAIDVCRKLDEFSHLANFLGIDKFLDYWDDPIAKSWITLEPIVNEERKMTGFAKKWKAFENVGKVALAKLVREGRNPVQ